MLKNYLKISTRNIVKNKLISIVTIAGFTVGLSVFLLILLFIKNEVSYDSFHVKKERIYRLVMNPTGREANDYGSISPLLSGKIRESFPQIEAATNFLDRETELKINGSLVKEKLTFADNDFFRIFSFSAKEGNTAQFGSDPSYVFLSESFAKKYFGNSDPMDKIISVKIEKEYDDFIIKGIVKDPPENSSLKFNMLIPFANAEKISWIQFGMHDIYPAEFFPSFFVLLKDSKSTKAIEEAFPKLIKPFVKESVNHPRITFYPLEKVHFANEIEFSPLQTSDYFSVTILGLIGLMILSIVSFNYINLTIAQSSHRFKEIGIRKVTGAGRKRIIFQFLLESFVIIFISLLISAALSELMLPLFNSITGKKLSFDIDPGIIISGIIILSVILSLLAGAYPSIVMSKLNPVSVLKGTHKLSGSKGVTKVFITVQFILAVILISGAIIINAQYNFIMNKKLGFDKDQVIVIYTNEMFGRMISHVNITSFKDEILKSPGVKYAAASDMILGGTNRVQTMWGFTYKDKIFFSVLDNIDAELISALNIKLLRGRNFSTGFESDSISSVIVNESFVKELSTGDPIGENIHINAKMFKRTDFKVIGVVKDFNHLPLKQKTMPMAFLLNKSRSWNECIYVKIAANNIPHTIRYIKDAWERLIPGQVFNYTFLDDRINRLYESENRWKNIITYSSGIAIFFACLGLFGLVFFSAQKRTKEIGVRKVLGASTLSLVKLLAKEFIVLIGAAFVLGSGVSYYFARKWLADYAYKIELNIWIFLSSALLVGMIVIVTLLIIAVKIANDNSVENLRYE